MAIAYHPKRGTIVTVNFNSGFLPPEMVKRRLCVVLSPPIRARVGLCTVVPLSLSEPSPVQPYHYRFQIPFDMPSAWGAVPRWAKCDMICAVGLHRVDLIRLGKDAHGRRRYQLAVLPQDHLRRIETCVLAGLGLPPLTG